jgi:riboflavin synthase
MCWSEDMFTGLVEAVGEVMALESRPGAVRLFVTSELGEELAAGDSLAVNGVCLTAVKAGGPAAAFDVGPESMRVTALGDLEPGDVVNLERAMRADDRFGGHLVLGHVDGVGTIVDIRPDGEFWWVRVRFPGELAPLFVPKGSVAVDGISLTIASLGDDSFDAQIVPHTWTHTNLGAARPSARVNLECDVIGKYVARAVALQLSAASIPRQP